MRVKWTLTLTPRAVLLRDRLRMTSLAPPYPAHRPPLRSLGGRASEWMQPNLPPATLIIPPLALPLQGIRVNAVAPGPIWTPFIPSTFPEGTQESWQKSAPMGRAGQPSECAPAYVFLASEDASFFAGQVLHPNGGSVINA